MNRIVSDGTMACSADAASDSRPDMKRHVSSVRQRTHLLYTISIRRIPLHSQSQAAVRYESRAHDHVMLLTTWEHENSVTHTAHWFSSKTHEWSRSVRVHGSESTEHSSLSKFPDGNLFAAFCWKLRADKCLQILISRRRWSISISHSKIIRKRTNRINRLLLTRFRMIPISFLREKFGIQRYAIARWRCQNQWTGLYICKKLLHGSVFVVYLQNTTK